jgi:ABC-type uncharacterized transport system ATPase component
MAFEQRFPTSSFFRVLGSFGAGKSLQNLLEGLSEVRKGSRNKMNKFASIKGR